MVHMCAASASRPLERGNFQRAPEMLEALKAIESKTCILGYDSGDSGVNALARAALARAEGRDAP